jgi:uncharacterized membrane protein
VAIVLDYVHLAAMTAWFGGLLVLAVAVRVATAPGAPREWLSALVGRFSGLALGCVIYLGVSGVYAFSLDVHGLTPLMGTTYGRVLLAKLSLFAVLVALGAVNRLLVVPRLTRAARAVAHLRSTVRVELVTAVLVLLAVAMLTSLAPGTIAWAAHERVGATQTVSIDHVQMTLRLAPGAIGDNFLAIDVVDARTGAVNAPARVLIKRPVGQGTLDLPATVTDTSGRERYSTDSYPIASAGPVDLDVTLQRDGFRPVEHVFTLAAGASAVP